MHVCMHVRMYMSMYECIRLCRYIYMYVSSIYCSMGSSPVGVQCTLDYYFPRVSVLCLPFQHEYFLVTPFLYIVQPFPFCCPLFVFPFISPNTTSFTSLLSSILQMCPNKFNFLSLILCKMFLLLPILFLISSFMIFCCHLTFRILR